MEKLSDTNPITEAKPDRRILKTKRAIYEALIEGKTEDGEYYIGRSYMDIPDEDGVIFVKSKENIEIGNWINCRITDVAQYDLIGEKIN